MAKREHQPGGPPEPTEPSPGPDIPPQPQPGPSPGEPPSPRPGEPIPGQGPQLADPGLLKPAAAAPSEVGTPLEVEPLSGPTEASADTPWPDEEGDEG